MPFERPNRKSLIERAAAALAAALGLGALLKRSVLRALSDVQAGLAHELHGHAAFAALQLHVSSSTRDALDTRGGERDVPRKAAEFSSGAVVFTGVNGALIPAGTRVQRSDGVEYSTSSGASINSGTATVAVEAVEPGIAGDAAAATELALVSSVIGVDDVATVDVTGIVGGADSEEDEPYRGRILQRIRAPFQGGSVGNYVTWMLEVAGVTRAWAIDNHMGIGTVGATFVLDDHPTSLVPDGAKVAEVDAYLQERRPVGMAGLLTFAPGTLALDPEIVITPDTPDVRAAVEASLEEMLKRETKPGGTILLSHIREAISAAEGEDDYTLVTPTADVVAAAGTIHVLGTITWS